MGDLLVLVGRNDIGKSTLLEALDIFFNEGKGCVKLDKDDLNKECLSKGEDSIEIEVEFNELPSTLVLDATNETSLKAEYLLTTTGTLRVLKRYQNGGKERIFVKASHPSNSGCSDLLLKKNAELRKIVDDAGYECADKTKNAELRRAIWTNQGALELTETEIEIAKIDAKGIWDQLKAHMPLYTLFQSDRKNSDADDEVQDPMRIAVREILGDPKIKADLETIASTVKARLDEVAKRTLKKLYELNSAIASSLVPNLPDVGSLKWADVFKSVSITSDREIPINKRGSGVKRLVLISFFRAEAERRQKEANLPDIVYAIEEPETSQHPEHQRALTDALIALSKANNTQVLLTTHSPEIVKRLDFCNILLVSDDPAAKVSPILEHELPYPSLNEVNFVAFGEASCEYHNELYGHIEESERMAAYLAGKPSRSYVREKGGALTTEQRSLTEYIRHQIHHPENSNNAQFTYHELLTSINEMRTFLAIPSP
jgi:predicted ATP-dependent endonuclease of OLD family